jgi:hypothetical protein
MTSNHLRDLRSQIVSALIEVDRITALIAHAWTDYTEANRKLDRWNSGYLLKHLLWMELCRLRKDSEEARARHQEFRTQLKLIKVTSQFNPELPEAETISELHESFSSVSNSTIWDVNSVERINQLSERTSACSAIDRTTVFWNFSTFENIDFGSRAMLLRNAKGRPYTFYRHF